MKTEKRCARHDDGVGKILPASAFYVVTNRQGKPALAGYCKECCKLVATDYHRANPEQANAAIRKWRRKHPEKAKKRYDSQKRWLEADRNSHPDKWVGVYRKHGWKKRYGITPEWYRDKLEEQGGTCAFCPATITSCGRLLGIDHCHTTEQIRGLLCDRCNNCLERLESVVGWAERALAYLAHYRELPNKIYTPFHPAVLDSA